MAVHAFFFIAGPGKKHCPMSQHGSPLVGDMQNVAMAFPALLIFKGGIGFLALKLMVILIHVLSEMDNDVFYSMDRFGKKEIEGIMGGGQMAVHTVGHKPLGIVYVAGGLPGLDGKLNFMAGSAELRGRSPHHGVVGDAEKRKRQDGSGRDEEGGLDPGFHGAPLGAEVRLLQGD